MILNLIGISVWLIYYPLSKIISTYLNFQKVEYQVVEPIKLYTFIVLLIRMNKIEIFLIHIADLSHVSALDSFHILI